MRTIVSLLASLAFACAGELHQAARVGNADRMRQLLAQHPSLNEADETGMTPLHVAVSAGQKGSVWLLLKAGADRQARDRQGQTVFDIAAKIPDPADRTATLYMLRNFGLKAPQEPTGAKPWSLESSVMRRQTDLTKMLLKLGADPNAVGTGGTTPLADAALKGDLESVRLLLAHGARPTALSQAGTQPIHDAALGDHAGIIQELVKHGADVNVRNREGQTPLHIAATMGKKTAVQALIALHADLTVQDAKGQTPLNVAERAGVSDILALLKAASGK